MYELAAAENEDIPLLLRALCWHSQERENTEHKVLPVQTPHPPYLGISSFKIEGLNFSGSEWHLSYLSPTTIKLWVLGHCRETQKPTLHNHAQQLSAKAEVVCEYMFMREHPQQAHYTSWIGEEYATNVPLLWK